MVHHHARAAVEHPGDRRAGAAAGRRRALPPGCATPTTSPSWPRAWRCRWCTRPGSPRWSSRCSTRSCCASGSAPRTTRFARSTPHDRPPGRRRRPRGPRHRPVRRPRRPRGRGRRAAPRPRGQGLRRGADARRRACAGGARRAAERVPAAGNPLPRRRTALCRGPVHATDRAWGSAVPPCTARWRRPSRDAGVVLVDGKVGEVSQDAVRGPGRRRPGPLPRGRRRPALGHPVRGGSLAAPAPGPARYGLRRHFAVSAVDATWSR